MKQLSTTRLANKFSSFLCINLSDANQQFDNKQFLQNVSSSIYFSWVVTSNDVVVELLILLVHLALWKGRTEIESNRDQNQYIFTPCLLLYQKYQCVKVLENWKVLLALWPQWHPIAANTMLLERSVNHKQKKKVISAD